MNADKDLATENKMHALIVSAVRLAPLILVESNDDSTAKIFKHDILAPILCRTKPPVRWGPQL